MFTKLKQYLRKHTTYGKSRYLNYLYRYDMNRYLMYSGKFQNNTASLATEIRLLSHALEKGLSVAADRTDFGKEKVIQLQDLIDKYKASGDNPDSQVVFLGESVLASYIDFRKEHNEDVTFLDSTVRSTIPAGVIEYTMSDMSAFIDIAQKRHSVRLFGEGTVPKANLIQAVALAQTAPSACNRQSSHVFVCDSSEKINKIMARHGGMRGFNTPGAILAVTGDLRLYNSEYERNTVFVDGGIFVMNLLYSLEAYHLAACPVIWGAEPDNDNFLYNLMSIPPQHEIISLVLVGNPPDAAVLIPRSTKRPIKDILHFNN